MVVMGTKATLVQRVLLSVHFLKVFFQQLFIFSCLFRKKRSHPASNTLQLFMDTRMVSAELVTSSSER